MKQLLNIKNINASLSVWILMTGLLFTGMKAGGQNINIPNKTGPMGLEVNSYTGNLYFERTDVVIPGSEIEMALRFSYSSYEFENNHGFGNGWGFEYDVKYSIDSAENMVFVWGDGRTDSYKPSGSGNFIAPTGYFTTLKEYEPGKFSITERNGTSYLFEDNMKKRLTRITGRNNHFISIGYTDTLITSISNHYGQTITLTYDSKGFLKTLNDAITSPARNWSYSYDSKGNLTEVTDPLGAKNKYSYIVNGPVKKVSDKNLNVVDVIYYPDYALRELIGCNKRMSFSYDTTQKMTVVTDHLESGQNMVNKYYYKVIGESAWLSAISSNCCGFDMVIEYDRDGNKISQSDANGNITRYTYDAFGNMLTRTNALGQTDTYTYTDGRVTSVKDAKGNIISAEYDQQGNLTKVKDAGGNTYSATYDSDGNMVSNTNPKGKTFNYTYDANGNLKTISGPEGLSITTNISPRGELLSFTNSENKTRSFQYDALGRLTRLTDPMNNQINFSYDSEGNLFLIKNKNNEQFRLSYDASNRIREVKSPMQSSTLYSYDGMDNITAIVNAMGATTTFAFNNENRLMSLSDAEGNESTFNYDRNGNIITQNLPSGQKITYTYDVLNRLKSMSDADGTIGTLEYDAAGNILRVTDASGANSTLEYDNRNHVKKITDALNNSSELSYDATGKISGLKDKNGKTTLLTYDDLDRIKTITDQNGAVTKISYSANGKISSLTDGNNNVTSYTYDDLGRLKRSTFSDATFTERGYDLKNNLVTFRQADGTTINYVYDSLNRLITKTLPDGQVLSYGYDALSRVISATNNAGTITFTYDVLNRVTSESFGGRTVTYSYDIQGRTQKTIYPDLTEVTKTFDTRNRLTSISKNDLPVVSYQYNNANQVISKTLANGVTTNYQYDFAGRLQSISAGSFYSITYAYDKNGNRTSVLRGNNLSEFYTYDNGNRLLTFKRGSVSGPYNVNNSFNYDLMGNRTSAVIAGKNYSYTHNALNQMLSANDGSKTINYTYDANGNLTFDGKYFKSYDANKRLIRDSASTSEVIRYQYDAIGRMTGKTINGLSLSFTYAGLNAIEERDGDGITRNRTIFNSYLQPVLNEHFEVPYYYHQNHLYSIEAISNASGNLVETYRYDAFGKQSIYNATGNSIAGSTAGNRYGFTGQVYDSSTMQNQFYFRNYNPETGLFSQQDLLEYGDGMHLYQYVGNNPANGVDILGLKKDPCDKTKRTTSEVLILKHLDRTMNYLNMINATLKKKTGADLTDKSKKLKWLSVLASVTSLTNKVNNLRNNWDDISTKDAQIEIAEIELALAGLSNDLGITDKIPGIGKEVAGVVSAFGTLDAFLTETTGHGMAYHYAHMSDNAEKLGKDAVTANEERGKWLESYIDAVIKAQGTEVEEWTDEAKEWLDVYLRVQKFKKEHTIEKPADDCPQNPKPKGPQKKRYRYDDEKNKFVEIIRSNDPNEIIGPKGQPDKRWVSVKDRLSYTITFENAEMASAPAKYVKVILPVPNKADASTFQLSNFGFNNQTFDVPASTSSSYQRLDARDSLGLFIDLVAGYDVTRNELFWEFQSIDPVTLMPPSDALKGFLLLQDTTEDKTKNGHGFVNFTIKPKADAHTLDSILAFAKIVFDANDTIPTNTEKNVIDAVAPTSEMAVLAATYTNAIPLNWMGQDDADGCGVHYYSLYYSTDGTNFMLLKDRMTRTDTLFVGNPETNYYFFTLATDSVGNTEQLRPGVVVNTYLGSVLPVSWLYFTGSNRGSDNLLEWATASEQNTKEFKIQRSFDGTSFDSVGTVRAAGNATGNSSYQFTDRDIDKLGKSIMYYRLVQIDKDGRESISQIIRINYNTVSEIKTLVYPNPTRGIVTIVFGDDVKTGTIAYLYDEAGKSLQAIKITSSQQQIDLSRYTNGIYFIKLPNQEVLKIVKR